MEPSLGTLDIVNPRLDRMESVLERLSEVSVDIKQLLAVHEQRLGQHEKFHDYIDNQLEKRKEDLDSKIDAVYVTMKKQDNSVFDEIKKLREESLSQYDKINDKISHMEKYIWIAIGGTGFLSWLIAYGLPGLSKIIAVAH
jgi:hypothetical protein